LQEAAP